MILTANDSGSRSAKLVSTNYTPTANSATTNEELLHSHQIPANAVQIGDMLEVYSCLQITASANDKTLRMYFNTSNSLSGATLVSTFLQAGATVTVTDSAKFFPVVSDTAVEVSGGATTSFQSPYANGTGTSANVTVPSVSAGFWILLSGQKESSAESLTIRWSMVRSSKI